MGGCPVNAFIGRVTGIADPVTPPSDPGTGGGGNGGGELLLVIATFLGLRRRANPQA
jgi:hypothetical protein